MKLRLMIFVLACLLLLSGCGQDAQSGDPSPSGEPSPTQAADTPSPEVSQTAEPVADHPDIAGEWYRTGCHSECGATVVISEQTAEGFTVEADCYYGAHMGHLQQSAARFTGETAGVMDVYGDYEYRSETGPKPPVEFTWDGDTMTITTEARDLDLGFGVNVYIHGTYTRGKPEYTNAGQLDRLLSPEEQERLRAVAGENYDWNVAQVLGNGTVGTDVPCVLADGRRARYISAWHSPNWGESLEVILAEDGRTYCTGNGDWLCTDDPNAAEMPEVAWPVRDDTHDFFTVPTGGRLGTLLVTVEVGPVKYDGTLNKFSVWSKDDLTTPIQTMEAEAYQVLHWSDIVDANFDGYMDFGYMYAMGNQPQFYHFWIWDEEQGVFVAEPEFDEISCPQFDPETGTITGNARGGAAGLAGVHTLHQWIDGKLVCVRKITTEPRWTDGGADQAVLMVEEPADGTLTEVFRKTADGTDILDEVVKWLDLSYHGET